MKFSMDKIKAIIIGLLQGMSISAIARQEQCSKSVVKRYRDRFMGAGLDPAKVWTLSDDQLRQVMQPSKRRQMNYVEPDFEEACRLNSGRNRQTLKEIWRTRYVDKVDPGSGKKAMAYSSFCRNAHDFRENLPAGERDICACFEHVPGDVVEIDYSGGGHGVGVTDPRTGEFSEVQIFVGVLPASLLTFFYATPKQTRNDWIDSMIEMLEYIGGVPNYIFLDNSTSLVTRAHKYDPKVCDEFQNFCSHYGTVPYPVRPGMPRDKAHVENGVKLCQDFVLSKLSGMKFFSIEQVNRQLRELCDQFNLRPLARDRAETRRSIFESREKEILKPLPPNPWEKTMIIKNLKVRKEGVVRYLGHRYSVPFVKAGTVVKVLVFNRDMKLEVRDSTGRILTEHPLKTDGEGDSIRLEHQSPAVRYYLATIRERLQKLEEAGEAAHSLAVKCISSKPEKTANRLLQGFDKCLKELGPEGFEDACREALGDGVSSYEEAERYFNKATREQISQQRLRSGAKLAVARKGSNIRGAEAYGRRAGNEG